jgi:hypothetical protein
MRFRITVRGDGIELRGYIDGPEGNEYKPVSDLSDALDPFGMVIASAAEDDYNPFRISEPEYPPTPEKSMSLIQHMWNEETTSPEEFIAKVAMLHFGQAVVIRQERALREKAETELRDRELHHFETEEKNGPLQKFAEYVMELHHANANGVCARCEREFPCSEYLMAKESVGA